MDAFVDAAAEAEARDLPSAATMLLRRLLLFNFSKKYKPPVKICPCPRCFARFVQHWAAQVGGQGGAAPSGAGESL